MPYVYPFGTASEEIKLTVWRKGKEIPDFEASDWRWDKCGAVMRYTEHGNRESKHGWEIDHIEPTSLGGANTFANLQPLHWENNARKGDQYPWTC